MCENNKIEACFTININGYLGNINILSQTLPYYLFSSVHIQRDECHYNIHINICQYTWFWAVPLSTALSHACSLPLSSHVSSCFCIPISCVTFLFLTSINTTFSSLIILVNDLKTCIIYTHMYNFKSRFCVWKKTCGICLSETGLFHLTWFSNMSIFLPRSWLHFPFW